MLYARNSGPSLPDRLQAISDASNSARYRPLSEMSLAWLWSLFGFNPVGHHVVNLVLHAINAVLVAVLGHRLTRDRRVSLLAGLVFAVLGCHTEAVVWMTARHELIAAALALLSVLSYIQFRRDGRLVWWTGALVLYAVSFGFKETALALPLFLIFYDVIFTWSVQGRIPRLTRRQLAPVLFLAVVGGGYTLFRLIVGGGYSVSVTLLGPPKNLVYYLLMESAALPVSTRFISRFPLATWPVIVSLVGVWLLVIGLTRGRIWRDRLFWFGVCWTVFALAPVILIVTERTTYFSSIGWALTAAALILLAWDTVSHKRAFRRWLVALATTVILSANLVTLTHRAFWWNQAAGVSYAMFSQVRDVIQTLPPQQANQLWFVHIPSHLEYAYAFGNRILFAAWLLQRQASAGDVQILLVEAAGDGISAEERLRHLAAKREAEGVVVAFYWQAGRVVQSNVLGVSP